MNTKTISILLKMVSINGAASIPLTAQMLYLVLHVSVFKSGNFRQTLVNCY